MAKQIKHSDIAEKGLMNPTIENLKELDRVLGTVIVSVKSLSKDLKKTFKGADLKTPEGVKKFKAGLSQLGEAEKQYQNTLKQRKVILAKMVTQQTEAGKANTKLKIHAQEQAKAVKALAREEMGLTSVYQKQSKKLNDLRKKYKDMALTQGTSGKAARKLRKEITKLDTKLKKIDASVGQFQRSVGNYSKAFRGLGRVLGAAGLTLGLMGLFRTLGNGLKIIRDFDQAQADLASIIGKSRKEIKELTKDAKRLGSTTKFTATQVAKLQKEYAKLGFSQKQILNLTESTLQLATATNTDLARAAEVVGNTLRAFSLDATQTQRVVDLMAKSFNESSLDMERFSTAMASVAPVAANAGVSIERTTAMLGTLVSAGIDASTAGTGLRNIFLELAKSGLTYEQAMNKINKASNKNAVALELFGKRGAAVGSILAKSGEKVDKLEKSLRKAGGTAKTMADEQLDTLEGQTKLMTSAWEGFILALDDGDGVIARVVRGAISLVTDLLNKLTELSLSDEQLNKKRRSEAKTASTNIETRKMGELLDDQVRTEKELLELSEKTWGVRRQSIEFRIRARKRGVKDNEITLQILNKIIEKTSEIEANEKSIIETSKQAKINREADLKQAIKALEVAQQIQLSGGFINPIELQRRVNAVEALSDENELRKLQILADTDQLKIKKELSKETAKNLVSSFKQIELERLATEGRNEFTRALAREELERRKIKAAIEGGTGTGTGAGKDSELTRLQELKKELKEVEQAREKALTTPEAQKSAEFRYNTKRKRELKDEIGFLQAILDLELKRLDFKEGEMSVNEKGLITLNQNKELAGIEGHQKAVEQAEEEAEANRLLEEQRQENITKQIEGIKSVTDVIAEEAQRRLQIQQKAIDDEISLARRRADQLSRLAERGQLEAGQSLAVEEKRIVELERKKLKAKQREQRIEASVAGFKLLADNVDKGANRPVADTIKDILQLSAVLTNLPTFYDGTEDTGKGGEGVDGKGGFKAVLHPHERVVDRKNNEAMQGLSNSELAEAAKLYNTGVNSDSYKAGQMPMQLVEHAYMSNAQILKKFDKLAETVEYGNEQIAEEIRSKPVHFFEYNNLTQSVVEGVKRSNSIEETHTKLGH